MRSKHETKEAIRAALALRIDNRLYYASIYSKYATREQRREAGLTMMIYLAVLQRLGNE